MVRPTVAQLEDGPEWPRIRARLETASLHDVAREFGLTPGVLAAAMVRSRTSRKAVIPRDAQEPGVGAPAAAPPDPTPEVFPPEPTAPARSQGKLDAHIAGYREATEKGAGRAFLDGLHRLVRVNLRARIAGTGETGLLGLFDRDSTRAEAPHPPPSTAPRRPRRAPGVPGHASPPTSVAKAREGVQQPLPDVAPPPTGPSHIYVVTVLLNGAQRQYGVMASSMGAAIATASRAVGAGVVVAVTRGLPALA